ncbi:MAG: ferrous iron transport protein A [Fusobacteria bacterium]|jgi:Fe2+ transport system protein FeoA|nr:ferrous iron transport protein A [Fusobacteriota bacterium]
MVMPLSMIKENTKAVVKKINCGKCLSERLNNIGLTIGEEIELRKNDCCNLILKVKNSNFVVGNGIANKILVEIDD